MRLEPLFDRTSIIGSAEGSAKKNPALMQEGLEAARRAAPKSLKSPTGRGVDGSNQSLSWRPRSDS
jgi:hypothetical protein